MPTRPLVIAPDLNTLARKEEKCGICGEPIVIMFCQGLGACSGRHLEELEEIAGTAAHEAAQRRKGVGLVPIFED